MPIITRWFNEEKTIVIYEVIGYWGVDDVLREIDHATVLLETGVNQPKYFIFDLTQTKGTPNGILSKRDRYVEKIDLDSLTLLVGADAIIRLLVKALKRMGLEVNVEFADNLENAQIIITNHMKTKH